MAPSTLAPGFSLRMGTPDDVEAVWNICMLALEVDPLYVRSKGTCKHDDNVKWSVATFGGRWTEPDTETYVIIEDATG